MALAQRNLSVGHQSAIERLSAKIEAPAPKSDRVVYVWRVARLTDKECLERHFAITQIALLATLSFSGALKIDPPSRWIRIAGYRLKDGKLVPDVRRLSLAEIAPRTELTCWRCVRQSQHGKASALDCDCVSTADPLGEVANIYGFVRT